VTVLTLKRAFIILAVTDDGTTAAKYQGNDLCDENPVFDTEALAEEAVPGIAERYHSRGSVPVLVIAPCFVRV